MSTPELVRLALVKAIHDASFLISTDEIREIVAKETAGIDSIPDSVYDIGGREREQ